MIVRDDAGSTQRMAKGFVRLAVLLLAFLLLAGLAAPDAAAARARRRKPATRPAVAAVADEEDDEISRHPAPRRLSVETYLVKKGDSLRTIARRRRITTATIKAFNQLTSDRLHPGQILELPNMDGVRVKLKRGDSLWELAAAYRARLGDIIEVNDIEDADAIQAGKELFIPSTTGRKGAAPRNVMRCWPVPEGRLTSRYGLRMHPILKRLLFHNGIDIAAPAGSRIVAFQSGTVVFSGVRSGYGNCVDIRHANGLSTRYGHCQKNVVRTGQKVKAGQTIARVGQTGLSTGPHLHFEIREGDRRINPLPFF